MSLRYFIRPGSALLLGCALATVSFAQAPPGISDSALQQIQSVLAEKAARNGTLMKVDPTLIYTARAALGAGIAGLPGNAVPTARMDSAGRVQVDIQAAVSDSLILQIQALGGEIVNSFPQYGAIRANVPVLQMDSIAANADVRSIAVAHEFRTNGPPVRLNRAAMRQMVERERLFRILPLAPSNARSLAGLLGRAGLAFIGSITSQAYVSHQANLVVSGLGIDGTGVKVGVLSDSATPARVAALIATGDLPPDTVVLPGQASTGSDEGTAMMEIVHDLAPGAKLYFATANGGQANFANNINALRAAGCDIIVDDITYF